MITIDNRIGSKDLYSYFPKGLAQLGSLEYADLSWIGNGPDGLVTVGVERKRLKDLLNSIQTGRLAGHQLSGLVNSYHVVYLIVEGIWRTHPNNGILEEYKARKWVPVALGQRRWMTKEIDGFLNTLEVMAQVIVRVAPSPRETVSLATHLYHWWQKDWADHKSHLAMHKNRIRDEGVMMTKPTIIRRVAAELSGVGWTRSKEVEKYFTSLREMISADEGRWREIPGIGKKLAKGIVEEIG